MKLYAFQPDGHGPQSFFVMAENEKDARKFVSDYIARKYTSKLGRLEYEAGGWETDYYIMTIANEGEIIENDNA